MTASTIAATASGNQLRVRWNALLAFLRRELAPFPGRGIATLRITVASVVVLVICMALRVPEAYLSVWIVLRMATEESGEMLLTGALAVIALTVSLALALVLLSVAMDQPALRFCLIGFSAAVAFFLRRTFAIGAVGFLIGFIPTIVLTAPDFLPTPEAMVRLTLWLWPVVTLGIAAIVAANLFIAPNDPAALLREELASRVRAAEAVIARCLGTAGGGPEPMRLAISGTGRMMQLLRDAGVVHPARRARSAQQRALIALIDRLATAAAALDVLPHESDAAERDRLRAAAARCARLRTALEADSIPGSGSAAEPVTTGRGSALSPTLVELETVLAQIEQTLADRASAASVIAPEPERPPLLAADAFTNREYLRYALKGALAVMICYLAQSAVNWPGIRTCVITCMIVGLTSEGATIQKGTLRFAGAIVGGALGFLAILVVIPNMESIASLVLLVAAGAAISAWVWVGSPRISYAGAQIALAFYMCVIQGFEPSWYFYTIRDRMIGLLLGHAVISLVFLSVWPVRAGDAIWMGLASALRAMAELARAGSRSDDQTAVARAIAGLRAAASRHFVSAQQSAEEESFEWSVRETGAAARDRFRDADGEARAVFVMQLAVANQRPNVLPPELPDALVAATRRFDGLVAENLDAIADRAQASAPTELPDLRSPLEGLTRAVRAEVSRIPNPEVARQVEGRLAAYRELVPRLERLGSAVVSRGLVRLTPLVLAGCMAYSPIANAPPSADKPWRGSDLQRVASDLGSDVHTEPERVAVETQKNYELGELIDLAQRTNPETRVAWEQVRQAALAAGIAQATYYPKLAAAATAAIASVPMPIPETVVPGGVFRAKTQFAIPALTLEWLLLDFGRRGAAVDGARALIAEANAGFNAKHQEVVFGVTRDFYALSAARGKRNASQAAYDSARTLAEAVTARKDRGLATRPELLQAEEEEAKAAYELADATAAESDARMALLETVGIGPSTPIEIADVSQRPLPPELSESIDGAVDRGLAQRPDLLALLAEVQAKRAAVRGAHADYWPRLAARGEYGGNYGELAIDHSRYQSVSEYQYTVGLRFEWDLFEGFARRNKVQLAQSQQRAAENELTHAREKTVRQVWKAYNDAKVALAKERAATALLAASEKSWSATLESYQHGLATFPDVRESQHSLAQARALEQASRAEAWTRAAAFAVSTGDLAQP
jgi:outer membrane protein TolC/uncharacterized membrane protein YccC